MNTGNILFTAQFVAKCKNNTHSTYLKSVDFFSLTAPFLSRNKREVIVLEYILKIGIHAAFCLVLGALVGGPLREGRMGAEWRSG